MGLSVIAVCVASTAGCNDSTKTPADGGDLTHCEPVAYIDDIQRLAGPEVSFDAEIQGLGSTEGVLFVCGRGFVARVERPATQAVVLRDPRFESAGCSVAAFDTERMLVANRDGFAAVVDLSTATPTITASLSRPGSRFFDVTIDGSSAFVAAGPEGVIELSVSGPSLNVTRSLDGASNALGVANAGATLVVADGYAVGESGGARVRLIDKAGGDLLDESLVPLGIATRVRARGDRAVVLRAGSGIDVYRLSAGTLDLSYSLELDGFPFGFDWEGSTVVLAAGNELNRLELGAESARLVSIEPRREPPGLEAPWIRGVERVGSEWMVAIGNYLLPLALGDGADAPYLSFGEGTVSLVGGQTERLVRVRNRGTDTVTLTRVAASPPFSAEIDPVLNTAREGCPGQFAIEPGRALLVTLRQSEVDTEVAGTMEIESNDPDRPLLSVVVEANRPVPKIGDPVENVVMPTVFGERFVLNEHVGRVRLAKLYDPT